MAVRGPSLHLGAPLARAFYDRPTVVVAKALLGCRIARTEGAELRVGEIVETEAYVARDPANHAFRGPTDRNRSMFAGPGTLYVYRIHQAHCANTVTRPGEAVLLRALAPVGPGLGNATGPGRLCRALGLDRGEDGADLTRGPVRIHPPATAVGRIVRGPRIGIRRAVERPLRFAIDGNPFVSSPRPWSRRAITA
ncbi:MAG: DNA-3-methyladenine glycosylase [Thermoplasmata archaeon]|nr:DNA-3-methyladenine glycosylase [Thermoplasmata archaeon]